ncbi:metal ABC transporter substrate-binding protein [Paenibacillus cremeus]|uniref:Zinc ABC transporter substrate-binding protein n=1 Tax=Paenibacillus cremeus TaxID=2163881 RepID=A0A559K432_9BACL|nr:metal ABC transporter substrate-binding protein [Paenibacillus cremeus]TVY06898.1 zinc ABC transporter substrate-binding protein [Paenibacillus cremeus]
MDFSINKAIIASAVISLTLIGCSAVTTNTSSPSGEKRLKVVTTFYPMYEFTKQIAGDNADVIALIPAGAEPHDWEPTAKDMKQVQEADVFVYNGAGVENWVDKALNSINKEKVAVVEASKGIELMEGIEEDEEDGHKAEAKASKEPEKVMDPHVWLDPVLAQKEVQSIEAALEKVDPTHLDTYKKNADAYITKLQELDKAFKDGLSNVKRKEFVTQHAAFAYMAKRYGLTQVPIAGLSPEEEPKAAQMAEIINFAKENKVKTIFFETLVAPKVAQTIAKEIGAKTSVLNPIEGLTDEDKKQKLDYIGIMKQNMNALKTALNE